jgi:hypothetical protein
MIYAIAFLILAQTCDPAPALAALFTPAHPRTGRYEVCVTDQTLEAAAGPGTIEELSPLDAFGTAGRYDRAMLSKLFGATVVRVARRSRRSGDSVVSETFYSPYPDATLTRVNAGTMKISLTFSAQR